MKDYLVTLRAEVTETEHGGKAVPNANVADHHVRLYVRASTSHDAAKKVQAALQAAVDMEGGS